jgi:hypothetical protein
MVQSTNSKVVKLCSALLVMMVVMTTLICIVGESAVLTCFHDALGGMTTTPPTGGSDDVKFDELASRLGEVSCAMACGIGDSCDDVMVAFASKHIDGVFGTSTSDCVSDWTCKREDPAASESDVVATDILAPSASKCMNTTLGSAFGDLSDEGLAGLILLLESRLDITADLCVGVVIQRAV